MTIVIASRDSAEVLLPRLLNIFESDHPAHLIEVIVAIDHSVGEVPMGRLLAIDKRVRVVKGDEPGGKAAALNAGVRAATSDVLIMADAQQRFDRRTIPELTAALEDGSFGAVSGALTLGGSGTPAHWYWALEKWIRHREAVLHSTIGVTGAVYAIRRALWPIIPVGTLLDDVFVPMSLVLNGYRVGFTHAARAIDVRSFDADGEAARKTRTSTGLFQLRELLPDAFSPSKNPLFIRFIWHKYLRLSTPIFLVAAVFSAAIIVIAAFLKAPLSLQAGILVALVSLGFLPPVRRLIMRSSRWFVMMNRSVIQAIHNGARSRWQVWNSR